MKSIALPWRGAGGLLLAASAAFSMSTLFSAIKPVLLTRFVEEAHFSQSLASLLVAAPFLGIATAALLLGGAIQRLPYRRTCWLLGALLLACEAVSGFYPTHALLVLVAQWVSGMCVGLLMGVTAQPIARHANRHSLFGLIDMAAVLLMSVMVAGAGRAVQQQGLAGGFAFAFICAGLLAAALFAYRPNAASVQPLVQPQLRPARWVFQWLPVVLIAMGMLFITFSGLGYAYMFTLAKQLGYSYDSAGTAIGFILFASAFACPLGGWCSARFGCHKPLFAAYITCALGWWFACNTQNPSVFLVALVPAICALQFTFPILLSLYGSLDEQGYWAAIAAPLLTSGFAWAAITAGQVVGAFGLVALPIATALGMLCCALLLWLGKYLATRSDKTGQVHSAAGSMA